jgi:hypothetical protein
MNVKAIGPHFSARKRNQTMMIVKSGRAQSRLEKSARESDTLAVSYEVQARIIREKTARLKALRLAKEAKTQTEEPPPTSQPNGAPRVAISNSSLNFKGTKMSTLRVIGPATHVSRAFMLNGSSSSRTVARDFGDDECR